MKVSLFATLAFAITCLAQGQDAEKQITFSAKAQNAHRMLAELSKVTGTQLIADGPVRQEILLLDVKDVPFKELLVRIARVTGAEWVKKDDGRHLIRSETLARKQAQEETIRRAELIRKEIAEFKRDAEKAPLTPQSADARARQLLAAGLLSDADYTRASDAARLLDRGAPAARLLARLIDLIPVEQLAAAQPQQRIVYSSTPTKMQRALSGPCEQALAEFAQEQNVWADAASKLYTDENLGNSMWWTSALGLRERLEEPIGKAILLVTRDIRVGYVSVHMSVADKKGHIRGRQSLVMLRRRLFVGLAEQAPSDDTLELSSDTKHYLAYLKAARDPQSAAPEMPADMRGRLANPEAHDPLSMLASDLIIGTARSQHRNVIALLPDRIHDTLMFGVYQVKPSAKAVLEALPKSAEATTRFDDGWMEIAPTWPTDERASRLDRVGFGKMLRAGLAKGYMPLDDFAAFALGTSFHAMPRLAWASVGLLFPEDAVGVMNHPLGIVRFYGALSPEQRKTLAGGGSLTFLSLVGRQRELLSDLIYGLASGLGQFEIAGNNDPERERMTDLRFEPTEVMPNGLDLDGHVSGSSSVDECAYAFRGSQVSSPREPWGLALDIARQDTPDADREGKITGFRLTSRWKLAMDFQLSQSVSAKGRVSDYRLTPGEKPVSLERLPARFRDLVQQEIERIKKDMAGWEGGSGIRKPPPPRRPLP